MTGTPRSAQLAPHVVIVGYGPVAARLVDGLRPSVLRGDLALTIIGEENTAAYNRVLVADVGVGRTSAAAITVSDPAELTTAGVSIRLNARVLRVDRARQGLLLADGTWLHYTKLVFATGARPVVPPLHGLNPDPAARIPLPRGVGALRDLADAAVLRNAVERRQRVVVLGGGILGLEAALAAREEGADVTVVHHGPHALGRSIDAGAGHTVSAALRARGITVVSNARAVGVNLRQMDDGVPGFSGLVQDGGAPVEGGLLVLSCGVRPRVELAVVAGLATDRGILVDHHLAAHHDPNVFAIGDCAQVRCLDDSCAGCASSTGPLGLIGPVWRQAEWLAGDIAAGPFDDAPGLAVSVWADPDHGKYVKMSTRDGVLAGFISVGMPRTGAELTLLFERGAELPADRSALLRLDGPGRESAASLGSAAAADPPRTVCRCAGVAAKTITAAVAAGCSTVQEVSAATRAGTGCGGCHGDLRNLMENHFAPAPA